MRTFKKLVALGKIILLYQSLITGVIFLITALVIHIYPLVVDKIFDYSWLPLLKQIWQNYFPTWSIMYVASIAFVLYGLFNLLIAHTTHRLIRKIN